MVQFFSRKVGIALSVFFIVIIATILLNRNSSDVQITGSTTTQIKDLASCLQDKGVKFYGSLDCPHCQDQKKLFTEAELKDMYIECGHLTAFSKKCQDLGITEVPTWVINGQMFIGLKTESELKTLANC